MLSFPGSFAWGTWRFLRWVMMSWHFFNCSLYTSLCACKTTLSCSGFIRSLLSNAIVVSFSSMHCWCFSFLCSRAFIWLSFSSMAYWYSSCIFSTPFLLSDFTTATALGFLDRRAISTEPSRLMKISWGLFVLQRGETWPSPSTSDLRRVKCDGKSLKLFFMFSMPRYFLRTALLNRGLILFIEKSSNCSCRYFVKQFKAQLFYLFPFGQKIFISGHQVQNDPCLMATILYLLFFILGNTPIPISWWVPSNG